MAKRHASTLENEVKEGPNGNFPPANKNIFQFFVFALVMRAPQLGKKRKKNKKKEGKRLYDQGKSGNPDFLF